MAPFLCQDHSIKLLRNAVISDCTVILKCTVILNCTVISELYSDTELYSDLWTVQWYWTVDSFINGLYDMTWTWYEHDLNRVSRVILLLCYNLSKNNNKMKVEVDRWKIKILLLPIMKERSKQIEGGCECCE